MLHYTKISLDLLSDVDMLLFLQNGIHGGVSYAATRHGEVKDGEDEQNQSHFLYLDANNLVKPDFL